MGQPVVHWELWSEDPERISNFYKKVFDWEIRYMPEMNYRLVETGDVDDLDTFNRKTGYIQQEDQRTIGNIGLNRFAVAPSPTRPPVSVPLDFPTI